MRLLILLAVLCAVTPLCAATLTVTNLNDTGAGSLRDTVAAAAAGDDIVFDASLAGGTLTLTTGQISTGVKALTITGPVTAGGKPDITISGNDTSRIFNHGATLSLNNLRLLDGHAAAAAGGAVSNDSSVSLSCTNCVFESCRTSSTSAMGGAIHGRVGTLTDCAFIGNSTPGTHAGGAVVLLNIGSVNTRIVRCTFEGNISGGGGAVYVSSAAATATVEFENTTFSANESTNGSLGGGAVYATSINLFAPSSSIALEFSHCTFADNTASAGASGQCVGLEANAAPTFTAEISAAFYNCVLTDNLPQAMFAAVTGSGGTVTFVSMRYNLCSDAPSWLIIGDQPNTDPQLLPLADNGGLTRTHALLKTSPAIDAGDQFSPLTVDQRGLSRTNPDIGSYEFLNPVLAIGFGAAAVTDGGYAAVTDPADIGETLTTTLSFSNDAADPVDLLLTVPISLSGFQNCTATVTTQPPATLPQGASSDVVLSVTPSAAGFFRFTVTVENNSIDGSYSFDVVGYAAAPQGGSGGDDDDDASCSTGTGSGLGWLALSTVLFALHWRRGRA